jgi:short-subunit dehydrogenase
MTTALITGASGGIGEALARELAVAGHDLVLVARSEGKLQALATELAGKHAIKADVLTADLAAAGAGVALAERLAGRQIDILVNNAGFGDFGEFFKADPAKPRRPTCCPSARPSPTNCAAPA